MKLDDNFLTIKAYAAMLAVVERCNVTVEENVKCDMTKVADYWNDPEPETWDDVVWDALVYSNPNGGPLKVDFYNHVINWCDQHNCICGGIKIENNTLRAYIQHYDIPQ